MRRVSARSGVSKKGLNKRTVLHELHPRIVFSKGIEKPIELKRKELTVTVKEFVKKP